MFEDLNIENLDFFSKKGSKEKFGNPYKPLSYAEGRQKAIDSVENPFVVVCCTSERYCIKWPKTGKFEWREGLSFYPVGVVFDSITNLPVKVEGARNLDRLFTWEIWESSEMGAVMPSWRRNRELSFWGEEEPKLVASFVAYETNEAMTKYYKIMGWGTYTPMECDGT